MDDEYKYTPAGLISRAEADDSWTEVYRENTGDLTLVYEIADLTPDNVMRMSVVKDDVLERAVYEAGWIEEDIGVIKRLGGEV
jgi:hypothetical protein